MRINRDLVAILIAGGLFFGALFFFIDRSEQRAHEAKMATCTTTIERSAKSDFRVKGE